MVVFALGWEGGTEVVSVEASGVGVSLGIAPVGLPGRASGRANRLRNGVSPGAREYRLGCV